MPCAPNIGGNRVHFKENRCRAAAAPPPETVISPSCSARSAMHRLFVAIRPPASDPRAAAGRDGRDQRRALAERGPAPSHPALHRRGRPPSRRRHPRRAWAASAIRAFEIALNGIGAFDRRGWPDAVWAGVTPHEPLKALHNKVDAALARVGVAPDQRAFLPHITLARLKRSSGPVGNLLEQSGGLASPPFTVDHFALFESTLDPRRRGLFDRRALSARLGAERAQQPVRPSRDSPGPTAARAPAPGRAGRSAAAPPSPARARHRPSRNSSGGVENRSSMARSTSASP